MKLSLPRVFVLCTTVTVFCALSHTACAQQTINLDFEPQKGQSTVYDFQVHANARDEAGLSLVTHATSTLEVKVTDVMRDPLAPVGETRITGAVIEISRKEGTVKFVSGTDQKTLPVEDQTVRITVDKDGKVAKTEGGALERTLTDTITAICAKLGTSKNLKLGDKWTVPVTLYLRGEKVPCTIAYTLLNEEVVDGDHCVVVSSASSLKHKFRKSGPVKSITMSWNGKAYYAHKKGRFARIVVEASAAAELKDGTRAEITDFHLQMTRRKEAAAAPGAGVGKAAGGILGGGDFPTAPIFFATAILLGLVVVLRATRRPAIRRALVCLLAAALVIYGMPLGRAVAASPGALMAFSNMATEALFNAGGLTGAGGAGVFMSGTPAGVLSTSYAAVPTWAGAGVQNAAAELAAGFLQVSAEGLVSTTTGVGAIGGTTATAGSGIFTATNMLIGGGVIAASAGAGIAAAGLGGGGGGGVICPTTDLPDLAVTENTIVPPFDDLTVIINTRTGDGEDVPRDKINIYMNNVFIQEVEVLAGGTVVNINLPQVTNTLKFEYSAGGGNRCVIGRLTVMSWHQAQGYVVNDFWVGAGNAATSTITRQ